MSFEEVVAALRARISKPMAASFFSALILGFVAHISAITELLMNWDSLTLKFGTGFALPQGKWLYSLLDRLHGIINVGSITVPLAILFCAVSAVILVKVLDIKRPIHAGLLGAAMAVFPSMMVICAYNSEDIFLFSVLLAVLSVYVLVNCKFGFVIGIILLSLSLGIYQAYIGFAAAALLILCIKMLFIPGMTSRKVLLQAGKYVLFLLLSILLYYIILQIVITVSNVGLTEYRGISDTLSGGSISVSVVWSSICAAYTQFTAGVWDDSFGTGGNRFILFYRLAALLVLLILCGLCIKNKLYRKPSLLIMLLLFVALFPLATNIIEVLSFGASEYLIMTFPFVMCVAFLITVADKLMEPKPDAFQDEEHARHASTKKEILPGIAAQWATIGICVCLVFNWYILDNQGYTRMKVAFSEAYSISMGMVEDITSCEGYNSESVVAVMGLSLEKRTDPGFVTKDIFSDLDPILGVSGRWFAFRTDYYWLGFVSNYMGYTFNLADEEKRAIIAGSEEYKSMPVFPSDGSTRLIDGVIVLKIA